MLITPAKRGKGSKKKQAAIDQDERTPNERHAAMACAQRLKRVFNIDIETCEKCQGRVKIIACVEDPVVIRRILEHLINKESTDSQVHPLPKRAPPQIGLFDEA